MAIQWRLPVTRTTAGSGNAWLTSARSTPSFGTVADERDLAADARELAAGRRDLAGEPTER